jgi:hypothetical protein
MVKKTLVSREEYVDNLRKNYDQLKAYEKVEIDGYTKIEQRIKEAFGDNPRIKTIINKAQDRMEDIAVYYKVGKEGSERWVRIFNIDGKALDGAFGKTFMMGKFTETAEGAAKILGKTGDLLEFTFMPGSKLNPASREIIENMFKIKLKDGGTIQEALERVYRQQLPKGAKKGAKFSKEFPEVFDQLQDMFRQIIRNEGLNYYYVGNAKGGKFLKLEDVLAEVDFAAATASWTSSAGKPQFKFNINPGKMDLDKYDDALEEMMQRLGSLDSVTNAPLGTAAETIVRQEVGILTALSEADTMFKQPAQLIKGTLDDIRGLFNWKLSLTDDYANTINRMGAQDAVIINQKGRRLVALSEEAVRRNPDGEKIIQELMDLGAEITEVDGIRKVLIPENTRTGQEIFGLLAERMKHGDDF